MLEPAKYAIVVSGAELEVIALALGRMLDPKVIAPKRAPVAKRPAVYPRKPPTLTDKARPLLEERWRKAVDDPQAWRNELAWAAGKATGRYGAAIFAAWGLDPETGL